MIPVTDAVILMAGAGSRLRVPGAALPKPLVAVGPQPLIAYAIDALTNVGVKRLHAVVGANGDDLAAAVGRLVPSTMAFSAIPNPNWQKQNGVSVLAAAGKVDSPFFLVMGDHLFDPTILHRLLQHSDFNAVNLAIDRKISRIFDLDDAMKVQTRDGRITAIGKTLTEFDAIDVGLFLASGDVFEYLERALRADDCSLADGIRLMAVDGKVRAIDIEDAWWQDVDTPEMLEQAQAEAARLWPNSQRPPMAEQSLAR